MTDFTVRRARRADAEAIVPLMHALGRWLQWQRPTASADDIRRLAFGPRRWCDIVVAADGDEILGYALTRPFFEGFTGRRRLFLSDLCVGEPARGRGVGRALMERVADDAVRQGCDVVTWELWTGNDVAIDFYAGFDTEEVEEVMILALERPQLEALASGVVSRSSAG